MKSFLLKIIPKSLLLFYHKTIALLAAFVYSHPSNKMTIIGVTGTDGKTTTVHLISKLLEAAGYKTAFLTTAQFKIGDLKWINDTKQTMPGRFKLQEFLREALDLGCTHVIVETSSQGILQSRHLGINYDAAVFTNLSPDHIEAHGGFQKYREEKEKLFLKLSKDKKKESGQKKISIINISDKEAIHFLKYKPDLSVGYGFKDEIAVMPDDLKGVILCLASNMNLNSTGTRFKVELEKEILEFETHLLGKFNVQNCLAAISCAHALGVPSEVIVKALKEVNSVPGRLELINEGQSFKVVVDYAHAENALFNVFKTLRPVITGNIISVLGSCGGGRDKKKRPKLGALAAKYADFVIVTNEDPYDEDPAAIIDEVIKGALENGKVMNRDCFKILSRKEAIRKAFSLAKKDDLVLITGKGSEQCIMSKKGKKIPWDDRGVAKKLLREMDTLL